MWDNRAVAHRAIPSSYKQTRRGIRTTVFGAKPVFDPASESRDERAGRSAKGLNGVNSETGEAKHRTEGVSA